MHSRHHLLAEIESETRMFISKSTQNNHTMQTTNRPKKPKIAIKAGTAMECGTIQSAGGGNPLRTIRTVEYDAIVRSDNIAAATMTICTTHQQRTGTDICAHYHNQITGSMHIAMDNCTYAELLSYCARDITERSNAPIIAENHCLVEFPFYMICSMSPTCDKISICKTIHVAMNQCLTSVDFALVDMYCFETVTSLANRKLRVHWPGLCVTHEAAVYMYRYIICHVRSKFGNRVGPVADTDWISQYSSSLPLITTNTTIRTCPDCRRHSTKISSCHRCIRTGTLVSTCQYAPTCVFSASDSSDSPFRTLFANELQFGNFTHAQLTELLRMLSVRNLPCVSRQSHMTANLLFRIPVLPYALHVKCSDCNTTTVGVSRCQRCGSRRVILTAKFINDCIPQQARLLQIQRSALDKNSEKRSSNDKQYLTRVIDNRVAGITEIVTKFLRRLSTEHNTKANSQLSASNDFVCKHFDSMFQTHERSIWEHCVVSDVYASSTEYTAILDGLGSGYCPFSGCVHPTSPSWVVVRKDGCIFKCECHPCGGRTGSINDPPGMLNSTTDRPDVDALKTHESMLFGHMEKYAPIKELSLANVLVETVFDEYMLNVRRQNSVFDPLNRMSSSTSGDL